MGGLLDDGRTRVIVLVHAVAEAHELDAIFAVLDLANERVDAATGCVDLLQHLHHGLVRATMQWAEECVDTG